MKVRVLGAGTSSGVPRIGNDWGACDPAEPRNRRMRASILVESATTRVLIDTGPDMREQLLAAGIDHVDAVLWTHEHADHCHGIDDLRQVMHARGSAIPGHARTPTMEALRQRFSYIFEGRGGYPPVVEARILPDALTIGDLAIRVTDQPHGRITSAGFRFDLNGRSLIYSTDFNILTDEMQNLFQGADLWIVDCLRREPHPTHAHLAATLEWVARCAVKRAVLTHMDNSMDYATLMDELPDGIEPGYDGMEILL